MRAKLQSVLPNEETISGNDSTFSVTESTFLGMGKTLLVSHNLNKQHIYNSGVLRSFLGSSLVCPWFLTRENLGRYKGRES